MFIIANPVHSTTQNTLRAFLYSLCCWKRHKSSILTFINKKKQNKLENLRIKLNFYKIISYLVDRCNSPAPSRSRQTLEKNVLSWALAWTGSVVFTRQVSPDTQLPYCACARMCTSSFCCLPSKVPLI